MRLFLAAVLCIFCTEAVAAPQCGPHDAVAAMLAEQYGEVRRSIGLAKDNTVVETYASPETGTWTFTVTLTDGKTCIIAAGDRFETAALPAPGDPA